MDSNVTKILLAIIAILAGISITVKMVNKKEKNVVKQKNNVVGGDQAGRDINN